MKSANVCCVLLLASLVACVQPDPKESARGDLLSAWNQRLLASAQAEDGFLTLKGVRTAAMLHLAVHDALNSVQARYQPYVFRQEDSKADPTAAAAQAAFEIASQHYPDRREEFEAELARWLTQVADGASKDAGTALGTAAASAILERRQGDRWDGEAQYEWHPMGPGVYAEFEEHSGTPAGFVFGAGWANARPFFLDSPDQFRVPPPPAIDSEEYTEAFREVKELGRASSSTRTEDQTHLALWWKDFVENSHNRLARQLVAEDDLDLWESARLFALLNMGVFDAYVNVFDNKFFYNHWRPYTAIRWAENDGNPATEPELDWDNTHGHSYAFPSYPSAHGTACAAALRVLEDTFGGDRPITMRTESVDRAGPMSEKIAMDPATRSFGTFAEAAEECAVSRVYLGIHFRYDSVEGTKLGTQIGNAAIGGHLGASR